MAITLQYIDFYAGLKVGGSGENLGKTRGESGVAFDEARSDTTDSLNREGERRYIQQQNTALGRIGADRHLTAQRTALDAGPQSHTFIGIQIFTRLLAGHLLYLGLNGGDTGGTAHQQNHVEIGCPNAGVL